MCLQKKSRSKQLLQYLISYHTNTFTNILFGDVYTLTWTRGSSVSGSDPSVGWELWVPASFHSDVKRMKCRSGCPCNSCEVIGIGSSHAALSDQRRSRSVDVCLLGADGKDQKSGIHFRGVSPHSGLGRKPPGKRKAACWS